MQRVIARLRSWCGACFTAALLITGCSAAGDASQTTLRPTDPPNLRPLATVVLSPTPDDDALTAESPAVTDAPRPTRTPQPTVYTGIFLGESSDVGIPIFDDPRFSGSLTLPTPVVSDCRQAADPVFGDRWRGSVGTALGCPDAPAITRAATGQAFETGIVFALPDGDLIAIGIGRFLLTPSAPPLVEWLPPPPPGLRVPDGAIGAWWRADAEVRAMLGHAIADSQPAFITRQPFTDGALIFDASSATTYALIGGSGLAIRD